MSTVVQFPFPNSDRLLGTFEDVQRYQSNFINSCKQQHQLCGKNHWICRIPRSPEPPCFVPDAKIWQQQIQLWQGLFIIWHFIFSYEWNGAKEDWVKSSFLCLGNEEGMLSVTAISSRDWHEETLVHRRMTKLRLFSNQWYLSFLTLAFPGLLFRLSDALCIPCWWSFNNRWNCLVSESCRQLLRIVLLKCHHPEMDCFSSFSSHLHKPLHVVMDE